MDTLLGGFSRLFPVWNTTRAAGITSYILLFFSMVAGMMQKRDMKKKTRVKLNLIHQSCGWFGLLIGLVHGLVLTFDTDVSLSLKEIFIPFTAKEDTDAIGLGTITLYIMALLIITSNMVKKLGRKVWKSIHFLSFPAYLIALYHGVVLGPDTEASYFIDVYPKCNDSDYFVC